ncbi:hypothetical protein ACIBEJ_02500 [Nonomuraea sp. NPDC050790]|uniref:hypothetical protein n=1 Tax=Nonomuraea sp. NPDC050790 TaxID=3364371 RepID=UPI0037881DBE
MDAPQKGAEPPAERPLLSSRALLIILTAVLVGVVVALYPALAVPVGIGVAVLTLLVRILGD